MPVAGTGLHHASRLPIPFDAPHTGGVLVVVGGDAVPDWAARWCARSGRELRRQVVPTVATDRVGAIEVIAASAARGGGAVLALPASAPLRPGPARVVAAVRNLPDDAQTVAEATVSAAEMGASLVVAHGVPLSFGERSIGLDAAVAHAHRLLDAAADTAAASAPGVDVQTWLARVEPHELVGEDLDADLLVVGVPRSDARGGLGLVARSALHHAPCAVLLIPRPARFPSGLPTCGP